MTSVLDHALALGFDSVLFAPTKTTTARDNPAHAEIRALARACQARGLVPLADLNAYALDLHHPLVAEHPECFAVRRSGEGRIVDPRQSMPAHGQALLRRLDDPEPLVSWWSAWIADHREAGIAGFRARYPGKSGAGLWRALIDEARAEDSALIMIADTPGETREETASLAGCGFDYTLSSLPWWDGRASWFVEEHEALRRIAPVIAQADAPEKLAPAATASRRARLAIAALTGSGLMMQAEFTTPVDEAENGEHLADCIRAANAATAGDRSGGALCALSGPGAPITILLRADGHDPRRAKTAQAAFINPDPTLAAEITADTLTALGEFGELAPMAGVCRRP